MKLNSGKIIIFARAPVPGEAKTRLIPALGKEGAAGLHEKLLKKTLETVSCLTDIKHELYCSPDTKHTFFAECAELYKIPLTAQKGEDLGDRMHNAFRDTLKTERWAIIIGTDCPLLCEDDIRKAVRFLEDGSDAVIGPAEDGGYYLIGMKETSKFLFQDIPWGTDQVFSITEKKLQMLRWNRRLLVARRDLDTPEDYDYFSEKNVIF